MTPTLRRHEMTEYVSGSPPVASEWECACGFATNVRRQAEDHLFAVTNGRPDPAELAGIERDLAAAIGRAREEGWEAGAHQGYTNGLVKAFEILEREQLTTAVITALEGISMEVARHKGMEP